MKSIIFTCAFLIVGCSTTGINPIGPDQYMIEKDSSGSGVIGAEISVELYKEANQFCAKTNKKFMKINVTEQDNKPGIRPASSKIEFHCVFHKE